MKPGTIVKVKGNIVQSENAQGYLFKEMYGSVIKSFKTGYVDVQFPHDGTRSDRLRQQARYRYNELIFIN